MSRQLASSRSTAVGRIMHSARKTALYRPIVDSDFWPSDLVAFWDFSEVSAPFYAKKYTGSTAYPLNNFGATNVTKVAYGPFGSSVSFNGTNQYLMIPATGVGDLNIGQFGDEVTVIAWYQPSAQQTGFIAGMWEETTGAGKRQYGLFHHLPAFGGENRLCSHISSDGGPTPGQSFNKDYSASARHLQTGIMKCVGMVYNGSQIKSYIDGIGDVKVSNNTNPYPYALGLNRISEPSDFTIGAVKSGSMINFLNGYLGGVAVFKRALTDEEMMRIHVATKGPNPILRFDYFTATGNNNTAATTGWKSILSASASDTSTTSVTNFGTTDASGSQFLFRNNVSGANPSIGYFPTVTGLMANQISKIRFRLNNSLAVDNVRLLVRINDAWYATHTSFSVTGNGRSAGNWTTAEHKSFAFTLNGAAWRDVTYSSGSVLGISPVPKTIDIPDGSLKSIGFYSESVSGTVRIDDLAIY